MSRIDELSVKLGSLQTEHKHLINEHWVPLQQITSGVMACLSALSGTDQKGTSPLFCSKCGRGGAPSSVQRVKDEDGSGCATPIPVRADVTTGQMQASSVNATNKSQDGTVTKQL